ncbi:MAG: sugar transferase [Planctomycetota bacterium]|jgi:exopolysaccharide biosynthesis polyprenyl glycosylphosphotransferase
MESTGQTARQAGIAEVAEVAESPDATAAAHSAANGRAAELHPANGTSVPIPWRAQLMSIGYILTDILAVVAAFVIAGWLYLTPLLAPIRARTAYDPADLLLLGLVIAVLAVLVFGALGLYRRGTSVLNVEEDVLLLKGAIFIGAVALALSFIFRDHELPRLAVTMAVVMALPLLVLGRRGVKGVASWALSGAGSAEPVIIYGAGDDGRQLAERLTQNPQYGLVPAGFLSDNGRSRERPVSFGPGRTRSLPLLGGGEQLVETAATLGCRSLFVANPRLSSERLAEIEEQCRGASIQCYHMPLSASGPFRRTSVSFLGDIPLISERPPSFGLVNRLGKRAFDVTVSGILLLVSAPLMLLIAAFIKLSSRGPVLFVQERVGLKGKTFRMFKFRTMRPGAPAYAKKPPNGWDPSITLLGRVLRRTSLDELPQLWNVLKGEMSLVGPRPEMPNIVADYDAVHRERLIVPPGMTGMWQISGDRHLPIHENIDYDLYYVYNQSLALDVVILARTAVAMFRGH